MEKQEKEVQQEQQQQQKQQALISTTASLDLSDYQRGQLTHLRSLVLLSPPAPPDPPAPPADAVDKEKDEEQEDLEYRKAAKILRKHMKHMRDEASKHQSSASPPANAICIAPPSQQHPAADGSSPLMVPVLSPGRTAPPNKRKMYRALPMNRESVQEPGQEKGEASGICGWGRWWWWCWEDRVVVEFNQTSTQPGAGTGAQKLERGDPRAAATGTSSL